jgi:hypothetical protein
VQASCAWAYADEGKDQLRVVYLVNVEKWPQLKEGDFYLRLPSELLRYRVTGSIGRMRTPNIELPIYQATFNRIHFALPFENDDPFVMCEFAFMLCHSPK